MMHELFKLEKVTLKAYENFDFPLGSADSLVSMTQSTFY